MVARHLYNHLTRLHFDEMWTENNKRKAERALASSDALGIGLQIGGMDYFLNPVKGRLYHKDGMCDKQLKKISLDLYRQSIQRILDHKPVEKPAPEASGPPLADVERDAWKKMLQTVVGLLEQATKDVYRAENDEEPTEDDYKVNLQKINRSAYSVLKEHLTSEPPARRTEPAKSSEKPELVPSSLSKPDGLSAQIPSEPRHIPQGPPLQASATSDTPLPNPRTNTRVASEKQDSLTEQVANPTHSPAPTGNAHPESQDASQAPSFPPLYSQGPSQSRAVKPPAPVPSSLGHQFAFSVPPTNSGGQPKVLWTAKRV